MTNKEAHIDHAYRQQNKKLLHFIRRSLPLDQAEDVLQDVFMQLFSGFDQIRSLEGLTSWLYKTATNRIIDVKRKKKPALFSDRNVLHEHAEEGAVLFMEDILPELSDDPEEQLFRKAIWQEIIEALDELPEEQKEVFVLHEFDDYSFNEISKITGEKLNTLISRKRYAVLYLREKLNEMYNQLKH